MLNLVEASRRPQWETFTVQDKFATNVRINVGAVVISEEMLNLMLSFKKWNGARILNDDGEYEIGYGIGDTDDTQGYTETDSYSEWIGYVRNEQRKLRGQLPVISAPQTVFDALMSLYVDTGTWRTVVADEGTYNLADAVKRNNWLLAADILSRGKINTKLRKRESAVMRLADYSTSRSRSQQIVQGLHTMRTRYVNGITNEFDKKQTEFVYYRQLGSFLPGMSQLRQRRIIAQART
jgi:hypothetical protein